MKKKILLVLFVLFLFLNAKSQSLDAVSIEKNGTTSSSSYVTLNGDATVSLDVTDVDNVLVVATLTSKTTSGSATGSYRICDNADSENINSGDYELTHTGKDGIGTIVYVFDVSGLSGSRTWAFQHKTTANTINTSVSFTAIALYDGSEQLVSGVSSLGSPTEISSDLQTVCLIEGFELVSNTQESGGAYVAASIQNQKTDGGTSVSALAHWVLQYKKSSDSQWISINYPIERSPLGEQKGIVSLVGSLPENLDDGYYDIRIAHQKISGEATFYTQNANLVAVSLRTSDGFFPIYTSSKPQAYTTSSSLSAVIENQLTPQTNTDIFCHAQYVIQSNAKTEPAKHDIFISDGTTVIYDGTDFSKYLHNSAHKCSGSVSALITGLVQSTSYIADFRHASASGRNLKTSEAYFVSFGLYRSSLPFIAPITVNASEGIRLSSYSSLKSAFEDINSGNIRGNIQILINTNLTETAECILNESGNANCSYNEILIYPTAPNITVEADLNTSFITLNGADNITIDGRVNLIGDKSLTISNNRTSNAGSRTLRIYNSCENVFISNCIIKGATPATTAGVINIHTSSIGDGNTNIEFDQCDFTNAGERPTNVIYSNGSSGRKNSYVTIKNCNFYNHLRSDISSCAIKIARDSDYWTIDSNSFYDSELIEPLGLYSYYIVYINTSDVNNYLISNNYIGGSSAACQGSPFSIKASRPHYFRAIYIRAADADLSTISGNIIRNFDYSSTNSNPWDAFYIDRGKVSIVNNIVGQDDISSSIRITAPNAYLVPELSGESVSSINIIGGGSGYVDPVVTITGGGGTGATAELVLSDGVITGVNITDGGSGYTSLPTIKIDNISNERSTVHGVRLSTYSDALIDGNIFSSFECVGNDSYAFGFEGIYKDAGRTGNTIVRNNTFGSTTTANSIWLSASSENAVTGARLYGVYYQGNDHLIVENNTFSNFTNNYSGTNNSSITTGVLVSRGTALIKNNRIKYLSTNSANTAGAFNASLYGIGIAYNSAGKVFEVRNNEIHNLSNTNANARVDLYGIYFSASNIDWHEVSGNYVHDLFISSSDNNSIIDGVVLYQGKINFFNNIIQLGKDYDQNHYIYGVWDHSSWRTQLNCYYNTILIEGQVSSGETNSSYAFYNRTNNSKPNNLINNIFVNNRTGGTGGNHYSIRLWAKNNFNIDYNNYLSSSGKIGVMGNADKDNLSDWQAATDSDVNSYSDDPQFTFTGTGYEQYYPNNKQNAQTGTGVLVDFTGTERSATNPKIGALEKEDFVWVGTVSTDFANAANWEENIVPETGANISFHSNPNNNCVLDQNRIIGKITNASDKNMVLNSYKLTVKSDISFSGTGKIDASTANSAMELSGIDVQYIQESLFVDDEIDVLIIDNDTDVISQSDLIINQLLDLSKGNFYIGDNTLELKDELVLTNGLIYGGENSNLLVSGTGDQLVLPEISLGDLEINRTNGVILNGSLTINNSLILTTGVLDIDNDTLLFNGSIISGTSSILADDNLSLCVFVNSSSITLPSGFFSTNTVSNITISGGGLISGANLTITGVLNLDDDNPALNRGLLHMDTYELSMDANAITLGAGDVTGIVKRTYFEANTIYTFGNEHTHIWFRPGGTYPSFIKCKISIGEAPSWKTDAIFRVYDFIQNDGVNCFATISSHYLDSELNGLSEYDLSQWTYGDNGQLPAGQYDWGTSNQDFVNNRIEIANVNIGYFPTAFGNLENTLAASSLTYHVWQGNQSSDWTDSDNWSNSLVPDASAYVLIPSSFETEYDPTLPAATEIRSLRIDPDGILNSGTNSELTINGNVGAWSCYDGIFNPANSTVIFTNDNAAITGTTDFYNLTIGNNATDTLWMAAGTTLRIGGAIQNNGVWRTFVSGETTVEYNGENQNIAVPNDGTDRYSNLILSGSGTKTMPAQDLEILGSLQVKENSILNCGGSLTISGDLIVCCGGVFNSGDFNHVLKSDLIVNGTFNANSGYSISFEGEELQNISGQAEVEFAGLSINNVNHVNLQEIVSVNENLNLINGNLSIGSNTLSINGGITRTNGKICSCDYCNIKFGGTSTLSLDENLFCSNPTFSTFEVNRSGGVVLGNNDLHIIDELILTNGVFDIRGSSLSLRSDLSSVNGTLFTDNNTNISFNANDLPLTLPDNIFENNSTFRNFVLERSGGLFLGNQDIVIDNKLVLADGLIFSNDNAEIVFTKNSNVGTAEDNSISGSEYSYIEGCARKIGKNSFTFPVGNDGEFAPVSISDADGTGNDEDYFEACYYYRNPNLDGYSVFQKQTGIDNVSAQEYWTIERTGTNQVNLSLSWNERSGAISDETQMIVAHWNGSLWEDYGNLGTTGDTTAGTVMSILADNFSPFTLASKSNQNILPVCLNLFNGRCMEDRYEISWQTLSEINNDYFTIEKSNDLKNWEVLSLINGKANSSSINDYKLSDYNLSINDVYYRLKQTDFNGTEKVYNTIAVKPCLEIDSKVDVYPNPSSGSIAVNCYNEMSDFRMCIYNNNGAEVKRIKSVCGQNINISELKNGIYSYKIIFSNTVLTGKLEILR